MKIYNEQKELMTNYDKTQGKIKIERTLVATYDNYKAIPEEYLKGEDYVISPNGKAFDVFYRVATVIPYTAEEKQALYEKEVEKLIRKKYTLSQELSILRQRDTKVEEFDEYNACAEECKVKAKALYKGD